MWYDIKRVQLSCFYSKEGFVVRLQSRVRGILKKTIASATIASMLVCAGIPVYAQSEVSVSSVDAKAGQMTDIGMHWAKDTLTQWGSKGWVKGYADGTFRPDAQISRAEFATLVNRVFGLSAEKDIAFSDVMSTDWYYTDVRKAVAAKYLTGYSDGTLRPNQSLSRQEVAVVLARIQKLDLVGDAADAFSDKAEIGDWSKGAVGAVVKAGYMKGYADGTFLPSASIRRAEVIVALDRIVPAADVAYNKAGTYGSEKETQKVATNVIVEADGVTLRNMHIVGTLTISEKVGKGTVYLNNLTVDKAVIVRGGGKDSIHFNGGKYQSIVIGNTPGSEVRIVANANSPLPLVIEPMTSGQKVFLDGKFDKVVIDGKQNTIIPREKSEIQSLFIAETSEKPTVLIEKNATVKEVKADSIVTIDNQGTISKPIEGKQAEKTNTDLKGNKPTPLTNTTPAAPTPLVNTPTPGGGTSSPPANTPPGTTTIASATVSVAELPAPKFGDIAKTSFEQAQFTANIAWSPTLLTGGTFDQGVEYTANITLNAKSGFSFANGAEINVNSKKVITTSGGGAVTIAVKFPATTETITLDGTKVYVANTDLNAIGLNNNIQAVLTSGTISTSTPSFSAFVELKASHGYVREVGGTTVKRENNKTYIGKVIWDNTSKSVSVAYPTASLPSDYTNTSKFTAIPITGAVEWTASAINVKNLQATYISATVTKAPSFTNSNGATIKGVLENVLKGNTTTGILKVTNGVISFDYSLSGQTTIDIKVLVNTLLTQLLTYTPTP
jgi:sulfur transfer complex TusBCD TusB component (DsrH family)